ncbi:hypoxanthine phosphoribosyltransferase [Clostridiales bacterium]|nr:hypoxanthine phosphoribosyltransferase [Clostridiales bacterium]
MGERIETLITKEQISKRVNELADQIMKDYSGEELYMVCVLKGGIFFMVDLARKIKGDVLFDFMVVSSYGAGTESSGHIKIKKDLDGNIEGKNVLIVEDIIDSGNTLSQLRKFLLVRNPKSLKICTILDKPSRREVEVPVDYVGFEIPDKFVVGYGLDYDQRYRNLDYIGSVIFE